MIKSLILTIVMATTLATSDGADVQATIESQTGLQVDGIKVMEEYGDAWGAYYCYCDGDIYCITLDDGAVDVCQILN